MRFQAELEAMTRILAGSLIFQSSQHSPILLILEDEVQESIVLLKVFSNKTPLLNLIHIYPSGASEPTAVYKEPLFVEEH